MATANRHNQHIAKSTLKFFEILRDEYDRVGQFPTRKEVAERMGWGSSSAVSDTMRRLAEYGLIERMHHSGPLMTQFKPSDK